jgi:hypothetical protein
MKISAWAVAIVLGGCQLSLSPAERNAIFDAVSAGNVEQVRRALDKGVSPNLSSRDQGCLIGNAIYPESTEVLEILINAGADVNARSEDGAGALMRSVKLLKCEHARILLANAADINERWAYPEKAAASKEYKNLTVLEIYKFQKIKLNKLWEKDKDCWQRFESELSRQLT